MKRKAIISVLSKQLSGTEEDNIEVVTPGEFYKEDESFYAIYEETEISGMEGTTTTLKISPEDLSLTRMGTTNAKMEFKKNKEDITMYNTPYGVLELKIKTRDLQVDVDDDGGDILIDYSIAVAGQSAQSTQLKINIKPSKIS